MTFKYYINLDERGVFKADVRNEDGETVYDISVGDEEYDAGSIFEDGFMKNKNDLHGLLAYLIDLDIADCRDGLEFGN